MRIYVTKLYESIRQNDGRNERRHKIPKTSILCRKIGEKEIKKSCSKNSEMSRTNKLSKFESRAPIGVTGPRWVLSDKDTLCIYVVG